MRIYPTFFNIFFKGMDPEKAHHIGFWGVQTLRNVGITRALRKYFQPAPERATTVMGITFPSPFGLAAGKNFMEYDLVYLSHGLLFWGARNVDGRGFDTEQNRPTNLQIPLARK